MIKPEDLRRVVKNVSDKDLTTVQVTAFLDIFGSDLEAATNKAIREFVAVHFGRKEHTKENN